MGGKGTYICCFGGRCFHEFLSIAHSILVQFLFSFFLIHFVNVSVVHLYSSIDTNIAWKNFRFSSSDRSHFNMIDGLSITVHPFTWRMNPNLGHLMLDGRNRQVNGQDQIVQTGNYCYKSSRFASTAEIKKQTSKDIYIHVSSRKHLLTRKKISCLL